MNRSKEYPKHPMPATSRRNFLAACGSCTALCALAPLGSIRFAHAGTDTKRTIRVVYALADHIGWKVIEEA